MAADRFDPHQHAGFLELDECSTRMNLTTEAVLDLVQRRVLRAVSLGDDLILVQPAVVTGAT
ncbi:Uncharacterised protein [Mycobacteroides abscessus subsp. abscessus]|nr:hypothetical protein DDT48_00170 [Mycobacteroides abscessus]SHQ30902.1 Uncharacterised protein [Mycobacteroides abscessus subsp. abscessus]RIR56715.1 hypothetical protein D2E37_00010 [Mycobacteroides abscessus]RIS84953.1 hypothetical protein D2E53_00010 [Mycobacteroides abscessus]RIT08108.1 hypothetical protein D2E74_00355 [Mycobacteroides abscessus]